jgi:hypothetical protein
VINYLSADLPQNKETNLGIGGRLAVATPVPLALAVLQVVHRAALEIASSAGAVCGNFFSFLVIGFRLWY